MRWKKTPDVYITYRNEFHHIIRVSDGEEIGSRKIWTDAVESCDKANLLWINGDDEGERTCASIVLWKW